MDLATKNKFYIKVQIKYNLLKVIKEYENYIHLFEKAIEKHIKIEKYKKEFNLTKKALYNIIYNYFINLIRKLFNYSTQHYASLGYSDFSENLANNNEFDKTKLWKRAQEKYDSKIRVK
jgi:hypothetical protein